MGSVVVENDTDGLLRQDVGRDSIGEAHELLMPKVLDVGGENRTVRVVAVTRLGAAVTLDRRLGLSAMETWDLRLFREGVHHRTGERGDVKGRDARLLDAPKITHAAGAPCWDALPRTATRDVGRRINRFGRSGARRERPATWSRDGLLSAIVIRHARSPRRPAFRVHPRLPGLVPRITDG